MPEHRKFAVFIDYDNISIGIKTSQNRTFRYEHVLSWIRSRGEVLTQVAYGSWSRHADARQVQSKLAAHGVRMEHLETTPSGGKNGADIALALEALELVFTQEHIDAFCIVSGDSDFLPLVHKLKRHDKQVYICAAQDTISTNLRRNCSQFISYEDLLRASAGREPGASRPERSARRKPRYQPLERALPYVREAIRDMLHHGETPLMNELSDHIAYREPGLDPRSFSCETFKELIYRMLEAGYLWKQPIGSQMFCVAVSDGYDDPPPGRFERSHRSDRPREPQPQSKLEAPWGVELSGQPAGPPRASEPRGRRAEPERQGQPEPPAPEVALPRGSALEAVVSALEGAIQRIKKDDRVAELGLVYEAALRIDPKFRSHCSRRKAFQPLLEGLVRKGLFTLSEQDGLLVVDSLGPVKGTPLAEGLPARPDANAVSRAKPEAAAQRAAAQSPAAGPRKRAQPLRVEAVRKARAATSEAAGPAPAPRRGVDLEFNVSGPVADALALIVPVLRANKDLVGPGLSRAELKDAVLAVQPDFKCTQYGVRTYRDLFSRARNEGLLETRDEDGQGTRYFGTERLSEVPLPKV